MSKFYANFEVVLGSELSRQVQPKILRARSGHRNIAPYASIEQALYSLTRRGHIPDMLSLRELEPSICYAEMLSIILGGCFRSFMFSPSLLKYFTSKLKLLRILYDGNYFKIFSREIIKNKNH